ncbi:TonB-dependent receptor domain-containing protein [Kangiella shandongensis]|uniref:TonB-dependent receptor domain-containing protein n=1 Tax=Kangiella shandongensis TaxID=2763258 RepID=UPI001CBB85FD|nr:TonB-dependent receptor [Kangiella shandongensis]
MTNKTMIAKAVKVALYSGFAASMAVSAPATFAADEDGAEEEAERIVVTGSRLKRSDVEGANPITVIDRETIELSGATSASELMRELTFNSSGSLRPQSGSSAQGVSTINLRGIGSGRTLVLIDGRRLTHSPSTGQGQDLNSIPLGAIERIEVLTDGASAVYGSDAIGGVVNVITRQDYNGAELMVSKGEVSVPADGGDRETGHALFGSSDGTTSLLAGVSWNKREIIFERDFPWVESGTSIYGANFTSRRAFDFVGIPGACSEENYFRDGALCRYNFNATNATEASNNNESIFLKARHQINDDWELYSNASVNKTKSFGRYAPVPDSTFFYDNLLIDSNSYNNPTNPDAWYYDPNNPNSVAYDASLVGAQRDVDIWHRFAAVGNRDNTVNNTNTDFLVGATGYVGSAEIDFGARRVRNSTKEIGNGYLAAATAWGFVNDFNPGYAVYGDNTSAFDPDTYYYGYNVQQPSSNPESVLSGSAVTTSRESDFNIDEVYASVAFDIMELDGGAMQMVVGAERREEFYQDLYDAQSEAGLVGGSAGNSAGGGRDVNAMYFETLMPFMDNFEVSLAGRYDDYSDYGNDFSPKIGFRYQPTDELTLRASWGEGFRAPTLDILTQKPAFSADSITDADTCDVLNGDRTDECQINGLSISNPDLSSEQSEQYAVGAVWQPVDWFDMTLDYSSIEIEDRITSFSAQTVVNRRGTESGIYQPGDANYDPRPIDEAMIVTRESQPCAVDPTQTCQVITQVVRGNGNEGTLNTSSIDWNMHTRFDLGGGVFDSTLQISYVDEYTINDGEDLVGIASLPEYRAQLRNQYSIGDFQFALNTNTIDANGLGDNHVGSWTTHDIQLNYNTPWDGRVTVGARNVGEKLPTLVTYDNRDYNMDLYHGYGRFTYVQYTQTF